MRDVTHVVFAAIWDGTHWTASPEDSLQGNLSLFRNLVEPLEIGSPGLEHVSVVHGTAAYPIRSEAILTRLRESDPRPDHPSFYFLQEDYLNEGRQRRKWAWTIWRATWIFGQALGGSMNAIPAVGIYGALLKERGEPLYFPGNPDWRVIREACDVDLLADAFVWAATHPIARHETYNVSNGDQMDWQEMWPVIADELGMEPGANRRCSLAEEMPRRRDEWAAIVKKYELLASTDPEEVVGESFAFMDRLDGYHNESQLRMQLSSTIKVRRHGFADCIDTEDMFRKHIRGLQEARILPPGQ
jgi:nucleoside-diphosphate-sugar epimerase